MQLYLHGLAEGDFELALRGLLGDGAPLSKSTVRRLRERWIAEHTEWERPSLDRGPGAGLRLGGRDLREGGHREGQGGPAGCDRSHGRRHQGSPRRGAGLPRVGRVVGRGAAGSQGPGARRAEAAGDAIVDAGGSPGRNQGDEPGGGLVEALQATPQLEQPVPAKEIHKRRSRKALHDGDPGRPQGGGQRIRIVSAQDIRAGLADEVFQRGCGSRQPGRAHPSPRPIEPPDHPQESQEPGPQRVDRIGEDPTDPQPAVDHPTALALERERHVDRLRANAERSE